LSRSGAGCTAEAARLPKYGTPHRPLGA
jgi:hypothetical protein